MLRSSLRPALALAGPVSAVPPAITPSQVDATIADGDSLNIQKTVETPAIPQNPEICFLADTTGSMDIALANVASQHRLDHVDRRRGLGSVTTRFCAAQYKDVGDFPASDTAFHLDQALTTNQAAVSAAAGTWVAAGGGDDARGSAPCPDRPVRRRPRLEPRRRRRPTSSSGSVTAQAMTRQVRGETLASTIAALNAGFNGSKRVIAVSVASPGGCAPSYLNATGQATAIAGATGGVFLTAATANDVANAILAGLSSLPVNVSMASDCFAATGGVVSTTFAPGLPDGHQRHQRCLHGDDLRDGRPVPAGPDLQLPRSGAPQRPADGRRQWRDHLRAEDDPGARHDAARRVLRRVREPEGRQDAAGRSTTLPGPKGGQNEDGFYLLTATDNVDPDPMIYVADSGSGFVAGPYLSGTNVKITQSPGSIPEAKKMAGVITAHIKLVGDALVYAVDASGNVSARASCLVPPPPK